MNSYYYILQYFADELKILFCSVQFSCFKEVCDAFKYRYFLRTNSNYFRLESRLKLVRISCFDSHHNITADKVVFPKYYLSYREDEWRMKLGYQGTICSSNPVGFCSYYFQYFVTYTSCSKTKSYLPKAIMWIQRSINIILW